jgi:hypothetical protein
LAPVPFANAIGGSVARFTDTTPPGMYFLLFRSNCSDCVLFFIFSPASIARNDAGQQRLSCLFPAGKSRRRFHLV